MFFIRCFFKLHNFDIIEMDKVCWPFLRRVRVTIPNTKVQREKQAIASGLGMRFWMADFHGRSAQSQALSPSLSTMRCLHSVNICQMNE